jgi:hypothetical protein
MSWLYVWREQRAVRVKENTRMENRSTPTELPTPAEARQVSRQDPHLQTIFIANKSYAWLRDSVGEWRS